MSLPNLVLQFKFLEYSTLTDNDWKLALGFGSNLELETMKSVLKQIFTKSASPTEPIRSFGSMGKLVGSILW